MNNNLLFNFSINKENKTVEIKREFAANIGLVWDCWTKPELLDTCGGHPNLIRQKRNRWTSGKAVPGFIR